MNIESVIDDIKNTDIGSLCRNGLIDPAANYHEFYKEYDVVLQIIRKYLYESMDRACRKGC